MNNEELEYPESRLSLMDYISDRNEEQMLETLTSLLEIMLSAFSTTVEEDRLILTQTLPTNLYNSIVFRMDQKEILLSSLLSIKYAQ